MTVYFSLGEIVFTVHGVKHEHQGQTSFEVRHVHVQGNCGDLLPLLKAGDFMDRIEEEAQKAADSPTGGVFFQQTLPRLAVELAEGGQS